MEKTTKNKKKWYKKWWIWVIIVFVLFVIVGAKGSDPNKTETTTTPKPDSSATQTPAPAATPAKPTFQAAYDAIQTGMTKAQVEAATGRSSESCTTSDIAGIGTYEYCTYGSAFSDKGTISVTYENGSVQNKTKTTF